LIPSAITYGDALNDSELKNGKMKLSESDSTEVPGTFTWKDGNIHPTVADSQKTEYTILFTPTDQMNHESVELKSTLYVMPAPNAPNLPGRVRNVSNSVTKVGDVTLPADWAWKSSDRESELEIGVTITATAEYTGADKGNYSTESVTVSITRDGCEHVPGDIFFTGSGEHAPTCTVDGLGHRECDICHKLIESDVIVKAAHKFSTAWTIDVNATTTSEGSKSHHCTVCDAKTDITAIPRIPASGGENSGNESGNIDDTANISTDSTQNNTETSTGVTDVVILPAISIPNPKTIAVLPEIKLTVPAHEQSSRRTAIAALINDEIPAQPFLQNKDGKKGWEVITSELADTEAGTTLAVDMNGASVVPGDIFEEIRGKDITIEFDLGNGIIWKVNGQSVQTDNIGNIDFAVKFGEDANDTIPVKVINNFTGERMYTNLSLAYDGPFGFDAVLTVNMGSDNTGLFANLFYYNEGTGELEFICAGEVGEDGNVELTFNHASEYTIVIDSQSMEQAAADTVLENESDDSTPATDGVDDIDQSVTPTTVNESSTSYTWVIFLAVAAIAVVGIVLIIKRRKK
ncbi:MAG TPA: hypothetical protein DCW90_11735, partial [Lachnospiraceae bacterium]|nr:hypothetical protein [Lachnospiraceae bacterium]